MWPSLLQFSSNRKNESIVTVTEFNLMKECDESALSKLYSMYTLIAELAIQTLSLNETPSW